MRQAYYDDIVMQRRGSEWVAVAGEADQRSDRLTLTMF
jgi:hypothetical protein